MESDPSVPKGDAGVTANRLPLEMTVDGKVTEFRTYRPEDLKRPSVLVHGARRGVSFLVDAKRALSSVLVWGRERALSLLRGFGTAWENFLESRLGRMLFPTLERQFVVPLGTSGGLGAPAAGRQGRPKKMADIFPNEPTHWSSVQREDLAFVLTQLGEGADSVRFLTAESTDETLVFCNDDTSQDRGGDLRYSPSNSPLRVPPCQTENFIRSATPAGRPR